MSLIDSRIPAALDEDGMSPDEKRQYELLCAHHAFGLLIQRIPADVHMYEFTVRHDGINAMPHKPGTDDDQRRLLRRLARLLDGFEYVTRKHDAVKDRIAAVGQIDGVPIELWSLVTPCECGCHSEATS